MYTLKNATVQDTETIRGIIGLVWLESPVRKNIKTALFAELNLKHSIKTISAEILSQQRQYLLITENSDVIGFASYSQSEIDSYIVKIHQIYDLISAKINKNLVRLVERIEENSKHVSANMLVIQLNIKSKIDLFESLGFIPRPLFLEVEGGRINEGFQMIKKLT